MFLRLALIVCLLCVFINESHGGDYDDPPQTADTCKSHGGDCVESSFKCPDFLTYKEATDCGDNEICCIFV